MNPSASATTPLVNVGTDWQSQPPSALVEFILARFHQPLRRELPELAERARQVEDVVPGLASHLDQVRAALEDHLTKEEKILFPLIVAGRGATALMPIKVMMTEHEDHVLCLRRTRELTGDFSLPAGASALWRALYRDLQRLEDDLAQHVELENNVLFTRVLENL
jgi:regulator of cell morphogenesis and NO signaling